MKWPAAKRILPIGLLLIFATTAALAQAQPKSSPTALPHVPIDLPSQAPSGWDQNNWTNIRNHCQEINDKSAANLLLAHDEQHLAGVCMSLSVGLSQQPEPPQESPQPQFHNGPLPTPNPTPDGSSFKSNDLFFRDCKLMELSLS